MKSDGKVSRLDQQDWLGNYQKLWLGRGKGGLKCSVIVQYFTVPTWMVRIFLQPLSMHAYFSCPPPPIAKSCYSIDMHIWSKISQYVVTAFPCQYSQILCPSKSLKIFHSSHFTPVHNCWQLPNWFYEHCNEMFLNKKWLVVTSKQKKCISVKVS